MKDPEKALLDALLSEVNMLFNQGHTRMQSVYYIQYFSATIFGIFIATFADSGTWSSDARLLFVSFTPLPLLFLGFLQFREDQLMVRQDRYLFAILRPQILTLLAQERESPLLGFISYINELKLTSVSALLSGLRYGFPLASSVLSWFTLLALLAQDAMGTLSARQIVRAWYGGNWMTNVAAVFLTLSVVATIALLYGMLHIGRVLAPKAYALAPPPIWERPAETEAADA